MLRVRVGVRDRIWIEVRIRMRVVEMHAGVLHAVACVLRTGRSHV